jgi:aryl sulfotransferase
LRTIWLASYPKSGNTWLRVLIAGTSANGGDSVDINDLPAERSIASARGPFDRLFLLESGLLSPDEIDCLRPRLYEALARGMDDNGSAHTGTVQFVKVHDAYTLTSRGEPLLAGARGADSAIVIVRDPREVAASLANQRGCTIDEAISFMNNPDAMLAGHNQQQPQFRQKLLDWSGHVSSWLGQRDLPVHCVRYEDLVASTAGALKELLAFAGVPATDADVERAVDLGSFEKLRRQELENGFREILRPRPGQVFFRRGEAGGWRDELTPEQIARLEAAHAPMMRRLGYKFAAR